LQATKVRPLSVETSCTQKSYVRITRYAWFEIPRANRGFIQRFADSTSK